MQNVDDIARQIKEIAEEYVEAKVNQRIAESNYLLKVADLEQFLNSDEVDEYRDYGIRPDETLADLLNNNRDLHDYLVKSLDEFADLALRLDRRNIELDRAIRRVEEVASGVDEIGEMLSDPYAYANQQ
jgi:methyl-accepting chemotaxis protein